MEKETSVNKKSCFFKQKIKVGDKSIGDARPVYLIAEAGVAHLGQLKDAFKLVDLAASAGAEAVKFQVYESKNLISKCQPDWFERMHSKELTREEFRELHSYALSKNIHFLATAHEEKAWEFVIKELNPPLLKIGSGEVKNWTYLKTVAETKKPVLVSLGLHKDADIEEIVRIFRKADNPNLVLLHCVTMYPTPAECSNLHTIPYLKERFGTIVGYSDHTEGTSLPLAAVALGAKVVEKHIFLDCNTPGSQDARISCDLKSFPQFVEELRRVESSLGNFAVVPHPEALKNVSWARKSVVAKVNIKKGEKITAGEICFKRPGKGISPDEIAKVIGKVAKRDIEVDELITWDDLEA